MGSKLFIGTSGWHYKHWRGSFYPENLPTSNWLSFYSKHFNSVEINNSFYRLPDPATFDDWRQTTPRTFRFAVKGSRFTTHMKKLKDPKTSSDKFFERVERLERKLGVILFQLPPHWKVDYERLAEFFMAIPQEHQYVFEFRDESWLTKRVFDLLAEHNAALCIHDLGGQQSPIEITANFTYIRFHGPTTAKYSGSYSSKALATWQKRIEMWRKKLKTVYVYFNNDIGGFAPRNALELQSMLD